MTLTREQVLEMPAGPEMDALVAERVMGWRPHVRNTAHYVEAGPAETMVGDYRVRASVGEWHPSRDIAAAWEVLEAIREKPWDTITVTYDAGEYGVALHEDDGRDVDYASCESAPLAICRAALLSVLGEE